MISVAQLFEIAERHMRESGSDAEMAAGAGLEPDALSCLYERDLPYIIEAGEGDVRRLLWATYAGAFYIGVAVARATQE